MKEFTDFSHVAKLLGLGLKEPEAEVTVPTSAIVGAPVQVSNDATLSVTLEGGNRSIGGVEVNADGVGEISLVKLTATTGVPAGHKEIMQGSDDMEDWRDCDRDSVGCYRYIRAALVPESRQPGDVIRKFLASGLELIAPDKCRKHPQVELTIERDDRGEFTVHVDVNEYFPAQKSTGRDTPDDDGYVEFGTAWDDEGYSVPLTDAEIEEAKWKVFP